MSTRITLLNDDNAVWNDRDFMTWYKDFVTERGAGFLNVHRTIEHLLNASFEDGTGSISSTGWIGSDAFNAWYGFIAGTCAISLDTVEFDDGAQSLKIAQTVNNGSQVSGVRLTANASSFDDTDFRHLIPVNGGKDIRLAFALKTDTVAAGSGKGAQAAIQAYDENGDATGSEQTSTLVTGTQAFTDDTLDVTLPDDAKYIQITLRIVNTTGTAWFDSLVLTERGTDIEVTAQDPAAANLDVATGVCFFEIEDGDGNVFLVRFEVESAETVAITNNATANPRIDVIYAYYDNGVDADIDASNVGSIEVAVGTPAGSPTAPAVPANGLKIAEVYVAAGASVFNESTVTDSRVPVKFMNSKRAPGTGGDDGVNYEQVMVPATQAQKGMVVLNETPSDPTRPRVPTMEYAGLLTEAEKNSLLAGATDVGDSFDAGHALLAGMGVAIESDGDLYMLRPLGAGAFGTDTNINTSQNYQYNLKTQAVDISATKKLLIFVDSSGVANIQLREVTVNPATGAYSSSTSDTAAGAGSTDNFDFKMIDATTGILVYVYSSVAYARIITDIGSGITVGAAQNLGAASASQVAVEVISATEAVLIRHTSGTGLVSLQLTISGTTVTVGTTNTFLSTANNLTVYSVHEIDNNKHLICYQNSSASLAYLMVATYDTGTHAYTSIGTPVSLGEDATHLPSWNIAIINTTTALLGYATSSTGSVRARTISISGNVPTVNSALTMGNALYNGHVTLSKVGIYHWIVMYTSGSGGTYGYRGQLVEIDVDGFDAVSAVGSAIGTGTGSDTGVFGVLVNADYMLMLYAQVSGTDDELNQWALTHNFDGFIGLVDDDAADGASVAVTSLGKATPVTTPVAGSLYTAKHSGQLSTDPTTYGYPIVGVGRADGFIQVTQRAAA